MGHIEVVEVAGSGDGLALSAGGSIERPREEVRSGGVRRNLGARDSLDSLVDDPAIAAREVVLVVRDSVARGV
jgi:hypothetical protein